MDRTGLLTDHYELTMLDSWVRDGRADHPAVFEAFARRLPEGRRYGMLAGLGRLLPMIEDFTFSASDVDWLSQTGVISEAGAAYLRDYRFRGDIDGYPEGDLYFPGSPVLTVRGTLGECVLLETLILSVLNHDTAIASAASRMADAAGGRPMIEMGSRRTHEQAALASARAAYLAGFASTSNLAAGRHHGVPTRGTAAHAFTLAHRSEADAFASQVAALGAGTTLLVDTYDIAEGIRTAVRVAGTGLGAIRIDSGDLAEEAHKARALLDELGATGTRIVVTSDLDEYVMAALADAPIDGYGVGTRVATGSGHPTAGMVYKLVAVADHAATPGHPAPQLRPVAKASASKTSVGGAKRAWRRFDADGLLRAEWFTAETAGRAGDPGDPGDPPADGTVAAQVPLVRAGRTVHSPTLDQVRDHAASARATLPAAVRGVAAGAPYLEVGATPPSSAAPAESAPTESAPPEQSPRTEGARA